MSVSEIVNKVRNYAHVLRDDGVGYGDYVEAALAHPCASRHLNNRGRTTIN
jgi:hypothetical protein